MDDDILHDLKQFIEASMSQQVADIITQLNSIGAKLSTIDSRLGNVEDKIDSLSQSVAEAIEVVNEEADTRLRDYERRPCLLEQKAA
jgi:DNA anti-recombination protein RmuC